MINKDFHRHLDDGTRQPIRRLPEQLINIIAAGEMIERPWQVLKELLENAIDAHARQVQIAIENGGIDRIAIQDDGLGIAKEEMLLAFDRHATSKLADIEDLYQPSHLGFRGEALSAIAAVSRVEIKTKIRDISTGNRLVLRQGQSEGNITPIHHPDGTQLIVEDLFYHLPVRRQFLKQPKTEAFFLEGYLKKILAIYPYLCCQFHRDSRQIFSLTACTDERERLVWLFGKPWVTHGQYHSYCHDGIRCYGWLLPPRFHRADSWQQILSVNGRLMVDPWLQTQLRAATSELVPKGRYLAYVIWIELPPHLVDCNVHPSKMSCRFAEPLQVVYALQQFFKLWQQNHVQIMPTNQINHDPISSNQPNTDQKLHLSANTLPSATAFLSTESLAQALSSEKIVPNQTIASHNEVDTIVISPSNWKKLTALSEYRSLWQHDNSLHILDEQAVLRHWLWCQWFNDLLAGYRLSFSLPIPEPLQSLWGKHHRWLSTLGIGMLDNQKKLWMVPKCLAWLPWSIMLERFCHPLWPVEPQCSYQFTRQCLAAVVEVPAHWSEQCATLWGHYGEHWQRLSCPKGIMMQQHLIALPKRAD